MNDTDHDAAAQKLVIRRTLPASLETVWDAWTNPEKLRLWFAPQGFDVGEVIADVREGGRYRIEMREPDGEAHTPAGEYVEVIPQRRIQATWQWEGSDVETLLTVEFAAAAGNSTELTLTHERFPDAEMRDKHTEGWTSVLGRLEGFLN